MSTPSIAVVIPAYNRPNDLRRALESVAAQSHPATEVVVCDDGSTEDLAPVIAAFEARLPVRCIRITNSGGPARPRNVAVEHARSEWIALLDADDWWDAGKLAAVQPLLRDADVVYHKLRTVSGGRDYRLLHRDVVGWGTVSARQALFDLLTIGNAVPTSAAVVRRELYLQVDGMQHSPATAEDYDFWVKVALAGGRFKFLDRILGHYYVTPNSRSSVFLNYVGFLQEMFSRYEPHFDAAQLKPVLAYKNYAVAIQYLHAGELSQCRSYLRRAAGLRLARQRLARMWQLAKVEFRLKGARA